MRGGFWGFFVSLFRFLSGALLLFYFFYFLKWYIKGHFGKHFIWFWLWSALSVCIWVYEDRRHKKEQQEYWEKWGRKSGQEIWNENMKDYDPVRGY